MKYTWIILAVAFFSQGCKLMKKNEEENKPKSKTQMSKEFKPVDWAATTNIYEVNVRQYSREGTFSAFAESLPRLKAMGVETLWFMPIHPIGVKNRKGVMGSYYSIQDYSAVNPDYGTEADFKSLVTKAHALGFKIIIDWVANHSSWDNVWTKTHPEFYTKDSSGNFAPPYPDWEDVIHLNYTNSSLRAEMIKTMAHWVTDFGIDGFRCDMAHLVPIDFWLQARQSLDSIKPLFWLAETEEPTYHQVFDASYTWEFLHKMEAYARHETTIAGLDSVLHRYDTAFPATAQRLFFTSNHDENSHSGSEYERMKDAALPFAVLCATWNGIPLIYSGQEIPNRRRLAFFESDPLAWSGQPELHDFYASLLKLHSTHPAMAAGDTSVKTYRITTDRDQTTFSFLRKKDGNEVLVLLNLSPDDNITVKLSDNRVDGVFTNVFTGKQVDLTKNKSVAMKSWDYLVLEK